MNLQISCNVIISILLLTTMCLREVKGSPLTKQDQIPITNIDDNPQSVLTSLDFIGATPQHRHMIAEQIIRRHDTTILRLESVVNQAVDRPDDRAATTIAVRLLGRFHAVHSIQLLVTHLAFLSDPKKAGDISDGNAYPCAWALSNIGMPALHPITEAAKETDDLVTLELSAQVIRDVLGPELAIAFLHMETNKTPGPREKSRLARIISQISSIQSSSTPPSSQGK